MTDNQPDPQEAEEAGNVLTEGELRELAAAGDEEAVEELAKIGRHEDDDGGEPPVFDQDEEVPPPPAEPLPGDTDDGTPDLLGEPSPDDLLGSLLGSESPELADPTEEWSKSDEAAAFDAIQEFPSVYIGDTIRVGPDRYKVRMTHGKGVVSTTDGRRFKPGEYAVV